MEKLRGRGTILTSYLKTTLPSYIPHPAYDEVGLLTFRYSFLCVLLKCDSKL